MVKEAQPDLAMREGKWKLLCEYDGSKPMLFDLSDDIGESRNVAEKHPDITARLTKSLLDWHASVPADKGPHLGLPGNR
jgi:uncharacterized sulfatase